MAPSPCRRYNSEMPKDDPKNEQKRALAPIFAPWAKRVRARLAARRILAGAALGLLAGVGVAALCWWARLGALRPWAASLGLLGAVLGAWAAKRKRWSDEAVALYLDHKLEANEAIATGVELENAEQAAPAQAAVIDLALEALSAPPPKGVWPRVWRIWHATAPLAAAAITWLSLVGLPPAPPQPPPPPGSEIVRFEDVDGLDKLIALSKLDAVDAAQRKRLDEIAKRAERLRAKLREGMQRREAQAQIAQLRDAVTAERQRLGTGERRRGLDAALGKRAANEQLREATKALGDRDLTRFDREMAKLANKLEAHDRKKAKKALEEAAKAAKKHGAPEVAKSLREQKKLMEQRAKRAEQLRQLAKALGDGLSKDAKEALRDAQRSGSNSSQRRLADALGKALEKLSEADRKKLAEKLKEYGKQLDPDTSGGSPMSKEQAEALQKKLSTPEGQKQLAEQMKKWANQPAPKSKGSQREKGLGDAEKGLNDAQKQLGAPPMPLPMPGAGNPAPGDKPGGGKPGSGKSGDKPGNGSDQGNNAGGKPGEPGGPGPGGGKGKHDGSTKKVDGDDLRAQARTRLNSGAPNPGTIMGRTAGGAPETANKSSGGVLGKVGPGQVAGMDGTNIPEEYRQQVRRYYGTD